MAKDKVQFGLKNVYVAVYDETTSTYATPVAVPGAVQFTAEHQSETSKFYADNIAYYTTATNSGVSGTLQLALMSDAVKKLLLGYEEDATTGLLYEVTDAKLPSFALLFEIDGDANHRRNVYYNCTLSYPNEEHNTRGETTEPDTETFNFEAIGRNVTIGTGAAAVTKNVLKASITDEGETHATYDGFFSTVVVPGAAA